MTSLKFYEVRARDQNTNEAFEDEEVRDHATGKLIFATLKDLSDQKAHNGRYMVFWCGGDVERQVLYDAREFCDETLSLITQYFAQRDFDHTHPQCPDGYRTAYPILQSDFYKPNTFNHHVNGDILIGPSIEP